MRKRRKPHGGKHPKDGMVIKTGLAALRDPEQRTARSSATEASHCREEAANRTLSTASSYGRAGQPRRDQQSTCAGPLLIYSRALAALDEHELVSIPSLRPLPSRPEFMCECLQCRPRRSACHHCRFLIDAAAVTSRLQFPCSTVVRPCSSSFAGVH